MGAMRRSHPETRVVRSAPAATDEATSSTATTVTATPPRVPARDGPAIRRTLRGSGCEQRASDEVGAERGEDREVEETGGGHHRGVVPLAQCQPGHQEQHAG